MGAVDEKPGPAPEIPAAPQAPTTTTTAEASAEATAEAEVLQRWGGWPRDIVRPYTGPLKDEEDAEDEAIEPPVFEPLALTPTESAFGRRGSRLLTGPLTTEEKAAQAALEGVTIRRPKTRGECAPDSGGPFALRPCPFIGCKHHAYADVHPSSGSLQLNFPDTEPADMVHSCTLDIADRGRTTLEEVGGALNLTRERVRQIESKGLRKALAHIERSDQDVIDLLREQGGESRW